MKAKWVSPPSPDGLNSRPKPDEWFHKSIDFVLEAMKNPAAKVFIHCNGGISRAPSMAYAVLLAKEYHPQVAEDMIRQARPETDLFYKDDATRADTAIRVPRFREEFREAVQVTS